MVLALSDSWAQLITVLITALIPVLAFGGKVLLTWLKKQKWVEKAHLEDFFAAMIPQIIQWVESWATAQATKPTSEAKMAKFTELLKAQLPAGSMTDEEITLRAEAELKKLKELSGT